MSLTNLISILRVLTLPALLYFLGNDSLFSTFWALVVFFIAVLTAVVDDILFYKRGRSKVGSFLDPLADKIVIVGMLLYFVLQGMFEAVYLVVFILRDVIVGVTRFVANRDGIMVRGRRLYVLLLTYSLFAVIAGLLLEHFFTFEGFTVGGRLIFTQTIILFFTFVALIVAFISVLHHLLRYSRGAMRRRHYKRVANRNMVVLANKRSRGYHDGYRRRLLKLFARRRNAPVMFFPHTRNMFKGLRNKVAGKNRIVIAGGDGSFESALNYKPFHKKTLGFFPLGAGNAFYSHFYKGKRFEYLRSRFQFHEQELDVLEMTWDKGKRQTLFLNIGGDAEVMHHSVKRTQHGLRDYVKACWKVIVDVPVQYDLNCSVDGKKYNWKNSVSMVLAKVPYLGFGIRSIPGEVDLGDGQVYGAAVVNTHSSFFNKGIRIWALLLGMFNIDKSPFVLLQGKKIVIKSKHPFPIQAGGEFIGYSRSLSVKVVRKQKVLMI